MGLHLRQSAVTREWVLFATDRAHRPEEWSRPTRPRTHERPSYVEDCPFCPGHEDRTSGETARARDPAGTWLVRACENRFPAVQPGPPSKREGDLFHRTMGAVGSHEVIVESLRHDTTLALQSVEEVHAVLHLWRSRYRALMSQPQTEHVTIFKNHGPRGGTSLEHPHSQIVSLPVTPWQVRSRMEEALRFHNDEGECVFCHMLGQEIADAERVVGLNPSFLAFLPFAAYSPCSIWIFPLRHASCFGTTRDGELWDLARVLRDVLARFYHGLGDPDYNLVLRAAGRDAVAVPFFHWYLALVPRLSQSAGFEMGTGMFINTSLPEDDARFLREIVLSDGPAPTRPAVGSSDG